MITQSNEWRRHIPCTFDCRTCGRNNLRIKDQTLHISTATDIADNGIRAIPAEWKVDNVLDLVRLLLVPSPNRNNGSHSTQPVLVRAGPGTGKTWMAKQAVFTLADRLLRGTGTNDGIRLVPIVVFVQRIIYLLRESTSKGGIETTLLQRYIESVYSGKKMETWCTMLMQARGVPSVRLSSCLSDIS